MNERTVALILVLSALSAVVLTSEALAATCVLPGDQCFNASYSTASGGEFLTAGDPRIAASDTQNACSAVGGTWYAIDNMLGNPGVPVCKTGCCCDPGLPGQVKAPGSACSAGYQQVDMLPGDNSCQATCEAVIAPPLPQCAEGTITSACTCGNVPTTQLDIRSGYVCCWNGDIRAQSNQCPAKPSTYCELNTAITSACTCGTSTISSGACCTGSIPEASVELCTPPPVSNEPTCGNLRLEAGEQCDATYSYVNGNWQTAGTATCNSGSICSSTCSCIPLNAGICGDNVCDGSETSATCAQDCPSTQSCTAPFPAPVSFSATWSTANNEVVLTWSHPPTCSATRGTYRLQRSTISPEVARNNPEHIEHLARDLTTTTDSNIPLTTTTLYYALYATFNNGGGSSVTEQFESIPGTVCPTQGASYCSNATYGVNCNGYTATPVDCNTGPLQGNSICSLATGQAECQPAATVAQCQQCNGLFGTFPDDNAMVTVGSAQVTCSNPASTCYKDLGNTSVPLYQSCTQVESCGTYRSEAACESNLCGVANSNGCEWTESHGTGYCRAADPVMRSCADCTVENGCTAALCSTIGGAQCYFYSPPPGATVRTDVPAGCYEPEEVLCEMYVDQNSCLGGSDFDLDASYSGIVRTGGTHSENSRSQDVAQRGKCLWLQLQGSQAGMCVRDADDDNNQDLDVRSANLSLLRDFTNPTSTVLATPSAMYPKDFVVPVGTDGELFHCITRPGSTCYPRNNQLDAGQVAYNFSGTQQNGNWLLRYYSTDASMNLELVREFPFQIDTAVPQITIGHTLTSYQAQTGVFRSRTTLSINVSELATCTTALQSLSGTMGTVSELRNVYGQNFSHSYPQLSDGQYELTVTCVDRSQNSNSTAYTFAVDTNADITNPHPIARTPPLNTNTVDISIETARPARCRFGQVGSTWPQMQPYTVTGGVLHTHTVNVGTGEFRYTTACDFAGAIVYGNASDHINFAVDRLGPQVMLCDAQSTLSSATNCRNSLFNNSASENHRITLRCEDQPLNSPSFGCDKGEIFSCVENITGTSTNCAPVQNYWHDIRGTTPVRLKYYAVDHGGNTGPTKTAMINLTDKTPPVVTFAIE